MPREIRVAVCDGYPIFREGVVQTIRRAEGVTVVGQAATAEEVSHLAQKFSFDIILLEPSISNSLGLAKAILKTHQNVKVIFLAAELDEEHAHAAICAGAHGYLMKGITGTELIASIRAIHGGERQLSSELAWFLLTNRRRATPSRESLGTLENQVLDHASEGKTNYEIAIILGLSISTIKRYKTKLFRKIGVRNRVQAAVEMRSIKALKPTDT